MKASPVEQQLKELQILHSIALKLNATTELNHALKIGLTYTVELMNMQTGWIWLLHPDSNSVFLAASHQLPPAFTQHPERLSGWCYCIDKYLANDLESAANISEITCTRLKDLKEGTQGLRYHASVPLFDGDQKIGLLNIVSEASGQLTERQLELLHTIGDMLSVTISRTRLFEQSREAGIREERKRLARHIGQGLTRQIQQLREELAVSKGGMSTYRKLNSLTEELSKLADQSINELEATSQLAYQQHPFQYPITPLSNREMEVLELLKSGKTNKAIAAELFISERTVKFHVSTLLSKLQAQNRTDAVQIAVRRGLVKF
jgi:two-component system NarL family sensor kinase